MPPHDLGRKSLLLFASGWSTTVIGMLISILIARGLGPAAMGSIGLSLGLAGLVMAALLPGFGQAHLKRLAEGQDPGRCLGTMAAIQAALTILLLLALGGAAAVHGPLDSPELTAVFLFMLASQVATSFAEVSLRVFVAREWVVPHALILLAGRLVRLVTTVAILAWAPRVTWVAAAFALEGVLNGLVATAVLLTRYGVSVRPPTRESLGGYWSYARPFLVTTPIALFQDSVDRYLVGRWAGLAAAGYYHVARALWEALSSLLAPPGTFIFTRLAALYARRTPAGDREARDFFVGAVDKMLFVTIPLAFGFWALAGPLIELLYGASFRPATLTLRILVLAALAASVVNPYTLVVYALEQARRFIPVNALRVLLYLAVLWLLVPAHPELPLGALSGGHPGAAVARLVLLLFPAWVYWRWTRELAGIPLYRRTAVYLGGFALMALGYHGLLRLLTGAPDAGPVVAVPVALVALGAYLAALRAVHPGTRDNLEYAASLLSPTRFHAFLREGIRGG